MLYTRRDPYMCRAVRKERAPRLNSESWSESSLAAFRRVDLFSSRPVNLLFLLLNTTLSLSSYLSLPLTLSSLSLFTPPPPPHSPSPLVTPATSLDHLRRPSPIPTRLVASPFLPDDLHHRLLFLFYHFLSPVLTCLLQLYLYYLLFIYLLHNFLSQSPDSIPLRHHTATTHSGTHPRLASFFAVATSRSRFANSL